MAKVIITADVEDSAKWEEGFRTHVDLFESMSVSKPIQFTTNEDNEVAIYIEPEDLDKYLEVLDSEATAEAMDYDGLSVRRSRFLFLTKS